MVYQIEKEGISRDREIPSCLFGKLRTGYDYTRSLEQLRPTIILYLGSRPHRERAIHCDPR